MYRLSNLVNRLLLLAISLTGMPPGGLTGLEDLHIYDRRTPRFRQRFALP